MPYVNGHSRATLDAGSPPINAGELNYVITKACVAYLRAGGRSVDYDLLNEVVGVLESAKAEFYRRVVAPYEDAKLAANGDVYGRGAA